MEEKDIQEAKWEAIFEIATSYPPGKDGKLSPEAQRAIKLIAATPVQAKDQRFATGEGEIGSKNGLIIKEEMPQRLFTSCGYAPLKAVLVGIPDHDTLPDGPADARLPGALPGMTNAFYDPLRQKGCIEEMDAFCELLAAEGVQVYRPPLTPWEVAQSSPVGLEAALARESFTVLGHHLLVNQSRSPHRHKEFLALLPFLNLVKKSFPDLAIHLPPLPETWERNDDYPNDPRVFVEGGDFFHVAAKDVLVTLSFRATSGSGFRWAADRLEADGFRLWPTYLVPENAWQHGDSCLLPIKEGLCLAYLPAFVDKLLPEPILDWTVIPLTREEACDKFAANGLTLKPGLVCLPAGARRVERALEKKGVDVLSVPCDNLCFRRGGLHSVTTELWREEDA